MKCQNETVTVELKNGKIVSVSFLLGDLGDWRDSWSCVENATRKLDLAMRILLHRHTQL